MDACSGKFKQKATPKLSTNVYVDRHRRGYVRVDREKSRERTGGCNGLPGLHRELRALILGEASRDGDLLERRGAAGGGVAMRGLDHTARPEVAVVGGAHVKAKVPFPSEALDPRIRGRTLAVETDEGRLLLRTAGVLDHELLDLHCTAGACIGREEQRRDREEINV